MTAKMAAAVGDVTDLQQRHHPKNIPHLVKKIKGFPPKAKSFRNDATYQKLWGGIHQQPPPRTTVGGGGGVNLRVRPRVEIERKRYIHTAPNKFLTRNRLNRTKIKTSCRLKVLYKQNILNGSV